MFVYYHYSSYSHRSGLETANLYFISPPTFLFNATPSAIAVTRILLHYGRWFPAYFIRSIYAENQTWVNKFLGFCIRRNIFLGKMDIGISGGKNKNITAGMVFFFFPHFSENYSRRVCIFTSEDTKRYKLWSCQNVCEALIYLLDNIYIRFGTKLYRQIVGIPMGTNCAPLVADLFLFCYERDFMTSLSDVKQAEIIEAFKSTSRYLDDLLNIDNPYFEGMVNRIYPPELQLNKANTADTEAPFLDLHLSISNGFVSSKIYDKRDDFDFDIVNFPFLDGDVPRSTSYGVYISQLIRFARVSSHVVDFNARNKSLTAKLLQQGYRYHKLRKTFSKFYRRHYELVSKFNVGLKTLLHQGLSEPEFYGDLVYKFKKKCR